jgi:RES domain-containing protein
VIPAGGHPQDIGHIQEAAGRWNRAGEYGCLYTSETVEGAVAEAGGRLTSTGISVRSAVPRIAWELRVELDPVLDLGDPAIRKARGIELPGLTLPPPEGWAYCQSLADLARSEGFTAIRSPAAALPGAFNVNIYFDLRADATKLHPTGRSIHLPS